MNIFTLINPFLIFFDFLFQYCIVTVQLISLDFQLIDVDVHSGPESIDLIKLVHK